MMTFLRWLSRWPLARLHALGAVLGWLAYATSPSYRGRLQCNARQAGLTPSQRRSAVAHAGRMVAELPWLWLAPADRDIESWLTWDGVEHLEAALGGGRGVLLMTPHLGSFEVFGLAYAKRFGHRVPMTAMYRPSRKPWLKEFVRSSRARPGMLTAPANLAGIRQMVRALRQGQAVALLPDQVPPLGMGVWAPFFGRPAYTMTLASRLLQQTGAQPVLLWCERRDGAQGWVVHLRPPVDDEAAADPAAINRGMENLIAQRPEQYLWGYHRYKAPRDAQAESARASASASASASAEESR